MQWEAGNTPSLGTHHAELCPDPLRPTCPSCRRGTGRCRRWWRCWSGRCRHSPDWTCAGLCTLYSPPACQHSACWSWSTRSNRCRPPSLRPLKQGGEEMNYLTSKGNYLIQTKNPRKLFSLLRPPTVIICYESSREEIHDRDLRCIMYWMFWSEEATDPWLAD